ncbi:MAG TPA: DUF1569 domain-containing protein [Terriglobales bacterium]|nr:DUF1569 domain-containing protein [Terriglobales bacterium]
MHSECETVRAAIERATAGMSTDELVWHPEGKWSSAEVLEHLALSYSGTAKGMRRVLQSDAPNVRPATLKERLSVLVLVGLGYFPEGRKAPKQVTPRGANPEHILNQIQANLCEMDKVISDCEQRFGAKAIVLAHPVLGPINLCQWRKFHRIHCLHHMKQIQALRARIQGKN